MHKTGRIEVDHLIIGSGAAGLMAALGLQGHGRIALVHKGSLSESSTWLAQGGIAGVLRDNDSIEAHMRDTLDAGDGLCHEEVVRRIISKSRAIIQKLQQLGTEFDLENGQLHLTREGGHSERRIAHAKDATGRVIGKALAGKVFSDQDILHLEHHTAIDLIVGHPPGPGKLPRCLGAYLLNTANQEIVSIAARHTILATGGIGKVYLFTSNPQGASGDGIAMAWRAGCTIMNMEFVQFHPTCLYHPKGSNMLLSEALRGEGAWLVDQRGRRFCFDYDARGELAPRDIVARAIDHEMKKQGTDCMYLDARPLGEDKIRQHFPNIHRRLAELGLDMTHEPIPIVPAAHYSCGGVQAAADGKTNLPGLYAIGETACCGLHGANRLASNSLLECLVMADLCATSIIQQETQPPIPAVPLWDERGIIPETERISIKQNWDEIRATMSNYVGIVRSNERLLRAQKRMEVIRDEVEMHYHRHPVSKHLIELRNLVLVAQLIIRSALKRHESRGLHYSLDYPEKLDVAQDSLLLAGQASACQRILIRGKVQGVFFRQSAKEVAEKIGITGWVKNLANGWVETLICGNQEQISKMLQWLAHGPRLAAVEKLELEPGSCTEFPSDFEIRF